MADRKGAAAASGRNPTSVTPPCPVCIRTSTRNAILAPLFTPRVTSPGAAAYLPTSIGYNPRVRATHRYVPGTGWVEIPSDEAPKVGEQRDYFKGVAPSDLKRMSNPHLFHSIEKLTLAVESGVGTPSERANAQEALAAAGKEARSRRASLNRPRGDIG